MVIVVSLNVLRRFIWDNMYKLFLDDERDPTFKDYDAVVVRTYDEAVEYVTQFGLPSFISFDHDLGKNQKTGFDFAKWLVERDLDRNEMSNDTFSFYVHSQNPIGKANIEGLLLQYLNL